MMMFMVLFLFGATEWVTDFYGHKIPFPEIKNALLKERLKEYYVNLNEYYKKKYFLKFREILQYKEIPETLAMDGDPIRDAYNGMLYKGYIEKRAGEWYFSHIFYFDKEETLWIGRYFPVDIEYGEHTVYVLLVKDTLLKKIISPLGKFCISFNDTFWYMKFTPLKDGKWGCELLFVPFHIKGVITGEKVKWALLRQLKILETLGWFNLFSYILHDRSLWLGMDRLSGQSWERIEVWGIIIRQDSIIEGPSRRLYKLPWVNKPRYIGYDINGINNPRCCAPLFYVRVKPTQNPFYIFVYKTAKFWISMYLHAQNGINKMMVGMMDFPIFSLYILTFLFISVISFLIGFGIMKIKGIKRRKNE